MIEMPRFIINMTVDTLTVEVANLKRDIETTEMSLEQKKALLKEKESQLAEAVHKHLERRKQENAAK